MSNKTIIFDLDGTLADTLLILLSIYNDIAPKLGCKQIEEKDIDRLRDATSPKALMREFHVPKYKVPILAYYIKRDMAKHLSEAQPFKDIPEVVKTLHEKGFKVGILTSNSAVNALEFLKQNDMDEYFDFVYGSRRVFAKDKALAKIIQKEDLSKDDIVYVGDEIRDIVASKKANLKIISVTWGFNSKESLKQRQPEFMADKPKDILKIANNL